MDYFIFFQDISSTDNGMNINIYTIVKNIKEYKFADVAVNLGVFLKNKSYLHFMVDQLAIEYLTQNK